MKEITDFDIELLKMNSLKYVDSVNRPLSEEEIKEFKNFVSEIGSSRFRSVSTILDKGITNTNLSTRCASSFIDVIAGLRFELEKHSIINLYSIEKIIYVEVDYAKFLSISDKVSTIYKIRYGVK